MRLATPKTLLAIAIGIAVAAGATTAFGGQGGPRGDAAGCPDRHLARLAERLKLTPEQQSQVQTIIEEEHTAAERRRAETRKRIDGVLTPAQRAEQDARLQKRMERHLERLAKRLNLTAEQSSQVRAILEERRTNPDLARDEVQRRIAAVLTPEQQQRFEFMGPRDGHHGNQGCGPERPGSGADDGPDNSPDGPDDDGPDQPQR